ncbi:LacI family transcriptional regulator [Agromyces protaetiae]|uniref:LacI family transcriptional regulator n=1 Tax=Agromyces protaetiae TaxID=2509455 RepID=A0A4P6FER6_9MICO|nr:LacI family DNA-binding transcriptional regulator [Agromyces protaetiae]QAY72859.1 LacI family transcriptional regulator [Agromyces protaetiae]
MNTTPNGPDDPQNAARARPTLVDVAAEAGVALKTASRVLNREPNVTPEKIARVHAAMAKLGYRRNDAARALRSGITASVGLLVDDISDPFSARLARAVESAAADRQSLLMVASTNYDPERHRELLGMFISRRLDGFVIVPTPTRDEGLEHDATGIPMVFVDRPPVGFDADVVLADNRGGAATAVRHLVELGHRRIACLSHPADNYTAAERTEGFRAGLDEAGIAFDPALAYDGEPDPRAFTAAYRAMKRLDDPPTAVFTTNNRTSIALLTGLGGRLEGDALVGFDDFELAEAMHPSISVIAQHPTAIGETAAALLFERIDGRGGPTEHRVVPSRLIVRGSSTPPMR